MSKKNSKTYIIFLDLPKDIEQKIDLIRKKYSPNSYKKWKAHFTLKYDEELNIDESRLIKLIADFCSKLKPVELKLGNIKVHHNKGWNIYIEVINTPELIGVIQKLSQTLSSSLNKWELSDKFYPHISLKGGINPEEGEIFFQKITSGKLNLPTKILCSSVTLAQWNRDRWKKVKTFRLTNRLVTKHNKNEIISLSWGYPDLEKFPMDLLIQKTNDLRHEKTENFLQYKPSAGDENLRNLIVKEKMGQFGKVTPDEIIITPGGTFSIFLSALFLKKYLGYHRIGVIEPCYDTALEIFKILDFQIINITPLLEERKEISNVDCLYLIPRFNNPSGETFNPKYISTIRDYLNKKRGFIIEDDVYHIFNYSLTESYRSLKQQFPQQVLYLDSFSKILAPGFRLGYIAAPKDKIHQLISLQKYVLSSPSTLSQKLIYEILKENYRSIKKEINVHYRKKMETLLKSLNSNGLSKYYHLPHGGFYVWLRTQKKFNENIKKQFLDSDVNVVDGRIYFTNKPKGNYIRLSIANIANDEIDRAVKIIKKILYE